MSSSLVKILTASDASVGDFFGYSSAISRDHSVVIAGAPFEESGAPSDRGAVYVYRAKDWVTETKLVSSVPVSGGQFGWSVASSANGSVIVVGEPLGKEGGVTTGAAYVLSDGNWSTVTRLLASDGASGDEFGQAVAISADGTVVAVGAWKNDLLDKGAVYVYSGSNWTTETKLVGSAASGNKLGESVAISDDGTTVVGGSSTYSSFRGRVHVFNGVSWATETLLTASDAAADDNYGISVGTSADGTVIAIGATGWEGTLTDEGAVYVRSGASWATETILTSIPVVSSSSFGDSVSVSSDGLVVLVGAFADETSGIERGGIHLYSGTNWSTQQKFDAFDTTASILLGQSVSISNDGQWFVAGANAKNANRGAVYVYYPDLNPQQFVPTRVAGRGRW